MAEKDSLDNFIDKAFRVAVYLFIIGAILLLVLIILIVVWFIFSWKDVSTVEPNADVITKTFDTAFLMIGNIFQVILGEPILSYADYLAEEKIATEQIEKEIVEREKQDIENEAEAIARIEAAVLKYTNEARQEAGISSYRLNSHLSQIARSHSEDMAENNYLDHINLAGEDPRDRAERQGYRVSGGFSENIGYVGTSSLSNPEAIGKEKVDNWMNSPGHRKNILNPERSIIGIGCAYTSRKVYCTQNFN